MASILSNINSGVDAMYAGIQNFANNTSQVIDSYVQTPLNKILNIAQSQGLDGHSTLNSAVYRLTQTGPDFSNNMFSVYLLNMSSVTNRAVMSMTQSNTQRLAAELFSFRCTNINIPHSNAALLSPIKWGNSTIEKLSGKREGSHQTSITIRLDDHLRWWYLNDTFDVAKTHKTDTIAFSDDEIRQVIPHVFFPNTSNVYNSGSGTGKNTISQTLIISLSNIYSSRLPDKEEQDEVFRRIKARNKNAVLNSNTITSDYGIKGSTPGDIDVANRLSTTYPVYVFENVKFINKPDIRMERDNANVVTGDFNFIFSRMTKQWIKYQWKKDDAYKDEDLPKYSTDAESGLPGGKQALPNAILNAVDSINFGRLW